MHPRIPHPSKLYLICEGRIKTILVLSSLKKIFLVYIFSQELHEILLQNNKNNKVGRVEREKREREKRKKGVNHERGIHSIQEN